MAGRRQYSDEERDRRRKESWTRYNRKLAARRAPGPRGEAVNSEVEYTDEEREWLVAVDRWKTETGVRFPTLTQLLAVLKGLGYRRPG